MSVGGGLVSGRGVECVRGSGEWEGCSMCECVRGSGEWEGV